MIRYWFNYCDRCLEYGSRGYRTRSVTATAASNTATGAAGLGLQLLPLGGIWFYSCFRCLKYHSPMATAAFHTVTGVSRLVLLLLLLLEYGSQSHWTRSITATAAWNIVLLLLPLHGIRLLVLPDSLCDSYRWLEYGSRCYCTYSPSAIYDSRFNRTSSTTATAVWNPAAGV